MCCGGGRGRIHKSYLYDMKEIPDHTAVRVALWRALHVQIDAPPHVLEDEVGLQLAAPGDSWRSRGDMHPEALKRVRASMVARARFIEDLVIREYGRGVRQYVILGSGLDTFAERRRELAELQIFEIDQPETLTWKQQRLLELGIGIPKGLRFVPVDFEAGSLWQEQLGHAGFDSSRPAVVACTGVSLYLTREANLETLRRVAAFAPGSTLAMTFILPMDLIDPEDRPMQEMAEKGARAGGTPFISFFSPEEMSALAREAGFKKIEIVPGSSLGQRYFTGRTDGLFPSNSEQFLVAGT